MASSVVTIKDIDLEVGSFSAFKDPDLKRLVCVHLKSGLEQTVPHIFKILEAYVALGYIPTTT